jgi:hypothetical protein
MVLVSNTLGWCWVSDVTKVAFMLVQVMIRLGMQEIPAGNIKKRWRRNTRDISTDHLTQICSAVCCCHGGCRSWRAKQPYF